MFIVIYPNAPTTPKMKATPMVVMEEQPPLIDLSAVVTQVEAIVELIDPLLKEYFW